MNIRKIKSYVWILAFGALVGSHSPAFAALDPSTAYGDLDFVCLAQGQPILPNTIDGVSLEDLSGKSVDVSTAGNRITLTLTPDTPLRDIIEYGGFSNSSNYTGAIAASIPSSYFPNAASGSSWGGYKVYHAYKDFGNSLNYAQRLPVAYFVHNSPDNAIFGQVGMTFDSTYSPQEQMVMRFRAKCLNLANYLPTLTSVTPPATTPQIRNDYLIDSGYDPDNFGLGIAPGERATVKNILTALQPLRRDNFSPGTGTVSTFLTLGMSVNFLTLGSEAQTDIRFSTGSGIGGCNLPVCGDDVTRTPLSYGPGIGRTLMVETKGPDPFLWDWGLTAEWNAANEINAFNPSPYGIPPTINLSASSAFPPHDFSPSGEVNKIQREIHPFAIIVAEDLIYDPIEDSYSPGMVRQGTVYAAPVLNCTRSYPYMDQVDSTIAAEDLTDGLRETTPPLLYTRYDYASGNEYGQVMRPDLTDDQGKYWSYGPSNVIQDGWTDADQGPISAGLGYRSARTRVYQAPASAITWGVCEAVPTGTNPSDGATYAYPTRRTQEYYCGYDGANVGGQQLNEHRNTYTGLLFNESITDPTSPKFSENLLRLSTAMESAKSKPRAKMYIYNRRTVTPPAFSWPLCPTYAGSTPGAIYKNLFAPEITAGEYEELHSKLYPDNINENNIVINANVTFGGYTAAQKNKIEAVLTQCMEASLRPINVHDEAKGWASQLAINIQEACCVPLTMFPDDSNMCGLGSKDWVWSIYQAPSDGCLRITTAGSTNGSGQPLRTVLAVYGIEGNSNQILDCNSNATGNPVLVSCNNECRADGNSNTTTFRTRANSLYLIAAAPADEAESNTGIVITQEMLASNACSLP